ncbi:hypothetical protein BH24ACT5_BH24ACT5_13990 [soil metagenome]
MVGSRATGNEDGSADPGPHTTIETGSEFAGESVLEAMEPDVTARFDDSMRSLAGLVVGPREVGNYRLVSFASNDPNGNGRIDGRWYEPRIRTGDCSIEVDSAPIPTVEATFIRGNPVDPLSGDDLFANTQALMQTERSIGIRIQVFDDVGQRDAMALVMIDSTAGRGHSGAMTAATDRSRAGMSAKSRR